MSLESSVINSKSDRTYVLEWVVKIGQLKLELVYVLGPSTMCNTVYIFGNIFSLSCKNALHFNKNSTLTHCHCGLVMPYSDRELGQVNIGSGNGLVPEATKPLPEPMLTYHWRGFMTFTWEHFHRKYSKYQALKWVWILPIQKKCNQYTLNFIGRGIITATSPSSRPQN